MSNAKELLRIIRRLRPVLEISGELPTSGYATHKDHWIAWLEHYDGPGHYRRTTHRGRTAKFIYNHLHCGPMMIWLAEALEIERPRLIRAASIRDIEIAKPQIGRMVRGILPWEKLNEPLSEMW